LELALTLASSTEAEREVTVDVEILLDGELLYRPSATTVTCGNGSTTRLVRHLRAGSDAGGYQLRVTATAGSLSDRRAVAFEIR
jgi:hypothetical protein